MGTHYEIAIRAHEALLHAELEDFRSQLALLAKQELPSESPREWLPLYEALQAAANRYAGLLEKYARMAPYNWFNFYDFWAGT